MNIIITGTIINGYSIKIINFLLSIKLQYITKIKTNNFLKILSKKIEYGTI